MAFVSIPDASIAVGKPVSQGLLQNIKDNFDALNTNISSAIENVIPNGSFEIDSDSDGVPDNWTRSQYSGGTGAYDTTTPAHGAKAYKFTATTAGGGGYLTSDYIPCSEHQALTFRFLHKASVAGMRNIVSVDWYTATKAPCATPSVNIYDSTANPASWTEYVRGAVPPTTARFLKILIFGGYPSATTGVAYFDAVSITNARQDVIIGHGSGTMTAAQAGVGLTVAGTQVATPPLVGSADGATHSLSGAKINVVGGINVTISLAVPTAVTLTLALPLGYWTVVGIAHWLNGSGSVAGAWRITGIAIREA